MSSFPILRSFMHKSFCLVQTCKLWDEIRIKKTLLFLTYIWVSAQLDLWLWTLLWIEKKVAIKQGNSLLCRTPVILSGAGKCCGIFHGSLAISPRYRLKIWLSPVWMQCDWFLGMHVAYELEQELTLWTTSLWYNIGGYI